MATIRSIFAGDALDTRFNNGFEETSNGTMPTSWKLWRSELAQFTRDMTVYHSGNASVRISHSSGAQDGYPAYYVAPIKPIVGEQLLHGGRLGSWRGRHRDDPHHAGLVRRKGRIHQQHFLR